jgi:hypothetical protein
MSSNRSQKLIATAPAAGLREMDVELGRGLSRVVA